MTHISFKITGDVNAQLKESFKKLQPESFIHEGKTSLVAIYESYSFINNSTLGVTTILEWIDNNQVVGGIIASGGGEGIFNLSWGNEGRRIGSGLKELRNLCKTLGLTFEEIEE